MKKTVALILVLVLALSLAACGLTRKSETVQPSPADGTLVTGNDVQNTPADPNANNAAPGVEQSNPVVVTPAVVVTSFPVPSNTPAPTPTVAPTPEANATPAVSATPGIQTKTTATQEELDNGRRGYVSGDGVNMRDGIGTKADVIASYAIGTPLLILGSENGWTKVSVNGVIGYIYSDYVEAGTFTGLTGNNLYVNDPAPGAGDGNATIIQPDGSALPAAGSSGSSSGSSSGESNAVIIMD